MTKNNKPEIEIGVHYDGKGAQEAKKSLESVQQTTEQLQNSGKQAALHDIFSEALPAAKLYTRALEDSSAAQQESLQRAQALEAQMRLETLTKKQLVAEVQRLAAARREAAAAGNAQQVQQLTLQYKQARAALRDMNQQASLNKAAMMGQAMAGMQMAQNLASLAEEAKSGSTNIAGLANQVMSLGMAIKAGLGPIGLIMGALQAAQLAFDKWMDKRKKLIEEEIKANEQATAQLKKMWEESADAARWENKQDIKDRLDAVRIWAEVEEKEAQKQLRLLKEKHSEQASADERAQIAARNRYELDIKRIEALRQTAALTEKDARMSREAAEDTLRAEQERLNLKKEQRVLEAAQLQADIAKNLAEDFAQKVQRQFGSEQMKKVLSVSLPDEGEIAALQLRINNAANEAEMARLEKRKAEIDDALAVVAAAMRAMGVSTDGGQAAVEAWAREVQNTAKEQQKIKEAKQKEAEQAASRVRELQHEAQTSLDRRNAETAQLNAAREVAAAADARADREKEWAAVQRKSLAEQKAWLEKTKGSLKEGSKEWEKWKAESRKVGAAEVHTQLNKIKESYKQAEKQASEANRSESAKLAIHSRILRQTKRYLQELLARPDLDAKTQDDINHELRNTQNQLRSLGLQVERGAREAQKSLENFHMPDLKAKSKAHEKALDNLKRYIEAEVRRAEAAASRGDVDAVARIKKNLANLALRVEGCVGYTGQGEAIYKGIVAQLEMQLAGYKEENKGMSSSRIAQRDITARLKRAQQSTSELARHTQDLATALKEAHKGSAKTKSGQNELATQNEQTARAAGELAEQTKAAAAAAKKMTNRTNAAAEAMSHAADQRADSAVDATELRRQVDNMSGALEATRTLLAEVSGGMEACSKGMQQQQQELLSIKGELENITSVQSLALGVMRNMAEQLSRSLTQHKKEIDALREELKRMKKL